MSDAIDTARAAASAGRTTAGATLKAAREAAGLSVDAVAHQLKLAPRQVKALEDDDYQRLPGRTFVRGFARNYARFVQLDADSVLALMPAPESAPALERPTLAASRRPMGEIPTERVTGPTAARLLIPLLLAIVAVAGIYEYLRSPSALFRGAWPSFGTPAAPKAPAAPATAVPAPSAMSPGATPGTTTTRLPNPATDSSSRVASTGAKESAGAAAAAPDAGAPGASTSVPGAGTKASGAGAATGDALLILAFKGTSWVEVKDASGRLVLQMTGGAGMTQTVTAAPPLELALGNAPDVTVMFRGQSLDLAPYTRGNVARVALK